MAAPTQSAMTTWSLSLAQLLEATGGTPLSRGTGALYGGVGTDTRHDLTNLVFFALKGDAFDANDFLSKAADAGAAAIVTHRLNSAQLLAQEKGSSVAIVTVDDTLLALQKLAAWWRHRLSATILGVTGTNGKTTTKEFAAAMLSQRFRTQWSKGSFNNHWGVPITLLSLAPSHEVGVVEMGMNHPGELKVLVGIADPDVVVCTMVGRGHLEGMGSIEGVARGKAEIYECARADATFIFNTDNPYTRRMMQDALARNPDQRVLRFGTPIALASAGSGGAAMSLDVCLGVERATESSLVVSGHIAGEAGRAEVPVFGAHNVTNLMTAACFALSVGMTAAEIWRALPQCRSTWGRNQWVALKSGARALFDAYNANPESAGAAIKNFARLTVTGRKFAVLGEMREMGEHAASVHYELGRAAGAAGFAAMAFVGPSGSSFEAGCTASGFREKLVVLNSYEQSLAREIGPMLKTGDIVLFKGSRGVRLEEALRDFEPANFTFYGEPPGANKG